MLKHPKQLTHNIYMLSNFELIEMGKNYNVQIDDIVFKSDLKDIKI